MCYAFQFPGALGPVTSRIGRRVVEEGVCAHAKCRKPLLNKTAILVNGAEDELEVVHDTEKCMAGRRGMPHSPIKIFEAINRKLPPLPKEAAVEPQVTQLVPA